AAPRDETRPAGRRGGGEARPARPEAAAGEARRGRAGPATAQADVHAFVTAAERMARPVAGPRGMQRARARRDPAVAPVLVHDRRPTAGYGEDEVVMAPLAAQRGAVVQAMPADDLHTVS